MEPEYDITLKPGEGASDEIKEHFLDSMGLGQRNVLADLPGVERDPVEDEGVILSSLPDDMGFPQVGSEPSRGIALSFTVTRSSLRSATEAISLPAEDQPEAESPSSAEPVETPTPESAVEAEPALDDPETILELSCPECDGALVLKRRFLGVEGACVWCHTAIVAAESGRDGQVRIFPILGRASETPPPPTENPDTPGSAEPVTAPTSHETVALAPAAETREPTCAFACPPMEMDPAPSFGFLPTTAAGEAESDEWGASAFSGSEEDGEEASSEAAPNAPIDLESLYDTGGFISSGEKPTFGHTDVPSSVAPAAMMAETSAESQGFGTFLQTAPAVPDPAPASFDSFVGPTPWGPPLRVTAEPSVPPAMASPSIAPLSSPTIAPEDSAPAALPPGFSPDFTVAVPSWESAFGKAAPSPEMSAPAPSLGLKDGFAAAFGSGFGTGSADASESDAHGPAPWVAESVASAFGAIEGAASERIVTSSPVISGRDSGRSELPVSSTGDSFFAGQDSPGALPWGIPEIAKDEPPAAFPPPSPERAVLAAEALFPASPNAFTGLFGEVEMERPGVERFGQSLVAESLKELPAPAPTIAAEKTTIAQPVAELSPASAPAVASQLLGSMPKPKVRKGFLVLMVVILGFATGAALASFVLPVDRYVEAARAHMEAKFNPRPAVPVMPALPQSAAVPGTAASVSDFQP